MEKRKKQRLERAGWTVGSAGDFLELSNEEAALVDACDPDRSEQRERREG
jgi:hypothetical protein